ncbi:ClbS/DfsB family four-helix bundle protein [Campylobacter rectus]|uniref:ClbS/DfsB family four-helix bundle protein n=1 Tax=Campylobacter rectus TaxID=203 RepID=UPI0036F2A1DE
MRQEAKFSFEDRDKCVPDALARLYEQHLLLINFTRKNLSGKQASFSSAPHDRKTCPQINIELWCKHQNTPLLGAETKSHANSRRGN